MSLSLLAVVVSGAFAGGFLSGLAGFGTGLVALGIWLHAIDPTTAATLAAACSVTSQVQTIPAIWHAIDLRRLMPMLLAGVLGVPFGVVLLAYVDPETFRRGLGVLLLAFSSIMLLAGNRTMIKRGGPLADAAVGLGGGILGGLAGLSAPLPTMWAALRGWSKDHRRGVFQAFNLTVLAFTMVVRAAQGLVTPAVCLLYLCALPGTLIGAWLGTLAYRRLSDRRFHYVILVMLGLSGATLL